MNDAGRTFHHFQVQTQSNLLQYMHSEDSFRSLSQVVAEEKGVGEDEREGGRRRDEIRRWSGGADGVRGLEHRWPIIILFYT